MARVLATADIGSNTVHLLVAKVEPNSVERIQNQSEWLGLGEIVGKVGALTPEHVERLVSTISSFRDLAEMCEAERMFVFATEAIRRAKNGRQVLQTIKSRTGVQVDIIDGPREADLGLQGVMLDCPGPIPMLFTEVGGGSAQLARAGSTGIEEAVSLPLGTGNLHAAIGWAQPPVEKDFIRLKRFLNTKLGTVKALLPIERIVASGGVARGIKRALHPDGDKVLRREELDYLISAVKRLPLQVLCKRFGVKPKRALTLLPGAMLYSEILRVAGRDDFEVSEFGVREGAVLEMYNRRIAGCSL